jgi:hypothetical protein
LCPNVADQPGTGSSGFADVDHVGATSNAVTDTVSMILTARVTARRTCCSVSSTPATIAGTATVPRPST